MLDSLLKSAESEYVTLKRNPRGIEGRGIGMKICLGVMELHHGRLDIKEGYQKDGIPMFCVECYFPKEQ